MSELKAIESKDRRVVNIHTAEFTPFFSDGVENGAVLQLNDAKPHGSGFHIYRMAPGETTVAHVHHSDEEFLMLEGELFDHDGVRYEAGDLVWLKKGTKHSSYSPGGCLIAVYLSGERPVVD